MRSPGTQRTLRTHVKHDAKRSGLTLVETALIVSVLGVLLAIAVPTFVGAVQTSKVAEAASTLDTLYRASASYYETARDIAPTTAPVAIGASAEPAPAPKTRRAYCLPDAAGPTPEKPSQKAVVVDFQADGVPGAATWTALGFQPRGAIRYRYTYLPAAAGCNLPTPAPIPSLTLRAEGDLDGDGVFSVFERSATITTPGELTPGAVLHVQDRVE